jgi:uncharacterized protein with HEPN domain
VSDDNAYLGHILDAIDRIQTYTAEGRDAFMGDTMVQDAVVRNFEIIGEAAKRLSGDVRRRHSEIPWRQVAGFRDVLSHDYMSIDLTIVWNAIESHLPSLRVAVRGFLAE